MAIFIWLPEFLPEICWEEEIAEETHFSYFVLMSGLGLEAWLFRLISQYTNY